MKRKINLFLMLSIVFVVALTTIGYSVLNRELKITGELAYRTEEDIRIINFLPTGSPNNMITSYNEFSKHQLRVGFHPTSIKANITYDVIIQNMSDYIYVISDIKDVLGSNNLSYQLDNYKLGEPIGKNKTFTLKITFNYNSESLEENIASSIDFTFVRPYAAILKYDNTESGSICSDVQCALDDLYEKLR